eukprot:Gb_29886 [translate_table: standard]
MESTSKTEIEKFNGQNFELWKLKMEDLLVDRYQWIAMSGNQPTGMKDEDWQKMVRKAKSSIRLCLSDSVLLNVSGEATTKDLWDKDCKVKNPDKGKSPDSAPSIDMKTSGDEVGDVYLASSSIQVIFNKESCKMVRGAMALARGIRTGTLY